MVAKTCRQADRLDPFPPKIATPGIQVAYKEIAHVSRLRCLCRTCNDVVNSQPLERIQRCNCTKTDRWICLRCFVKETVEDKTRGHASSYYGTFQYLPMMVSCSYAASAPIAEFLGPNAGRALFVCSLWGDRSAATSHRVQLVLESGLRIQKCWVAVHQPAMAGLVGRSLLRLI